MKLIFLIKIILKKIMTLLILKKIMKVCIYNKILKLSLVCWVKDFMNPLVIENIGISTFNIII